MSYSIFENDREKYSNVVFWRENKIFPFKPYPNFQKQYSLVYTCPVFFTLGNDWIKAAIFFYQSCQQWFIENNKLYHYAFPTDNEISDNRLVNELIEKFKKYDSYESISLAYNAPYNGDVKTFLELRWELEFDRIQRFLFETIEYLSTKLTEDL